MHESRSHAELLVVGGATQTSVAAKFAMSPDALQRHMANHVSDEWRASLLMGPVARMDLASRVSEESSSVIDHFRTLRAGLWQMFSTALEAGDSQSVALLGGRLTAVITAMGRITGELASSPLISNVTTNNILLAPEFAEQVLPVMLKALEPYPEARQAVIAAFRAQDEAPDTQPALIEHEVASGSH